MNYRHAYHAGSFADVVKHAALALIIAHLKTKPAPFVVIDTHAGRGRYDLDAPDALKTGEAARGILALLALARPPAALSPYLAAVRRQNPGGGKIRVYPGSPKIARALLRPRDRLVCVELHPQESLALARAFAGDRQVEVREADGWQVLRALLPPPERRGVVLIDPSFEAKDEFARLVRALGDAYRRWATGIYLLWYPIKEGAPVADFLDRLAASGIRRILVASRDLGAAGTGSRLRGAGLVIVNPPWHLGETLGSLLAELGPIFAPGAPVHAEVRELVAE